MVNHLLLWQNVMLWGHMQVSYSSVVHFLFLRCSTLKIRYKCRNLGKFSVEASELPSLGSCPHKHLFPHVPTAFCFFSLLGSSPDPTLSLSLFTQGSGASLDVRFMYMS